MKMNEVMEEAYEKTSKLFNIKSKDIINIICQYDNELCYKILQMKLKQFTHDIEKLQKRCKYIHKLSITSCPHNTTKKTDCRIGYGYRYDYCKLCHCNLR